MNFSRMTNTVFILLLGLYGLVMVAESGQEPTPEPKLIDQWESECVEEYEKKLGYRQLSPIEKDVKSCRGQVGESFCIEDKAKAYKENCKNTKSLIWKSEQTRKSKDAKKG